MIDRGENHLKSGHLRSFSYRDADEENTFTGVVQSSQKSILCKVTLTIKKRTREIIAVCTCPLGLESKCSHMATILLHVHRSISCTDQLATWSQAGVIEYETQTIEQMIKINEDDFPAATAEEKLAMQKTILEYLSVHRIAVPAAWILKDNDDDVDDTEEVELHDLRKIIFSLDFALSEDRKALLQCALSDAQIEEIAERTVGQRENSVYLKYKHFCLTASNFGYILQAISRNSFPPSLFGRLLNMSNLDGVKAIQWGRQNEKHALRVLQEKYNVPAINSSGLYLHQCGVLGATPDGISENCVTEIKCPYTWRNDDLREVLLYVPRKIRQTKRKGTLVSAKPEKLKKSTYVLYIKDGEVHINKDHPYYSQVQGQIYFAKKQYANLFVWTTRSHILVKVPKDPEWESNIIKLENFYYQVFLPYVCSNVSG